jgi:hypothetical protein
MGGCILNVLGLELNGGMHIECGMRTGCSDQVLYAYWALGEWIECGLDNADGTECGLGNEGYVRLYLDG